MSDLSDEDIQKYKEIIGTIGYSMQKRKPDDRVV